MDAVCIMTSLLAGLCYQVKAPHSGQPEKPEVSTPGEPFRCNVRVLAAVTDCDRTKEAMVHDIPFFLFQLDSGHAKQAAVNCGGEQQEGTEWRQEDNTVATGRRQESDRKAA